MKDEKYGIELHTFNDWQSIKEDPTLNIGFFTGEEDANKENNTSVSDSKPRITDSPTLIYRATRYCPDENWINEPKEETENSKKR